MFCNSMSLSMSKTSVCWLRLDLRIMAKALSLFLFLLAPVLSAAATITCVAGCGEGSENTALGAKFVEPFAVAFDKQGNWYVCEHKGERIVRIGKSGDASILAGTGQTGYAGDGGAASQAAMFDPHGIVIAAGQQMVVADTRNHTVRKIDLKTGVMTTVAGTGKAGYSGDGGAAIKAEFNGTFAIDVDSRRHNLYVADLGNRRVRKIDLKSGAVTTIAGNGEKGVPEDGRDASASPLTDPRAVAVDSKGNVYVLERGGNALRVVDQKGKIRTLIAPASSASTSDATAVVPDLNGPKHLCVDRNDNVIIADAENHLVRKYNPKTGKTVTIAGTGQSGNEIVTADPLKTQLNRPHGVFVHPSGALYISDSYNHRILKLTGW
jgi:DNA-binding beta-propeller fold protein YncE